MSKVRVSAAMYLHVGKVTVHRQDTGVVQVYTWEEVNKRFAFIPRDPEWGGVEQATGEALARLIGKYPNHVGPKPLITYGSCIVQDPLDDIYED